MVLVTVMHKEMKTEKTVSAVSLLSDKLALYWTLESP